MNEQQSISGWAADSTKRPSKQYGASRICAQEDCLVKLSRYNPGKWCSAHENPRDKKNMAGDGRSQEAKLDRDNSIGFNSGRRTRS